MVPARGMIAGVMLFASLVTAADAAEVFVAGVQPDRRPEGAPRVLQTMHSRAWYVEALTGIAPPYPHSLFFLDAQGDWYSPFVVPGMPDRYDIRGWRRREAHRQ
ncbi:MAG: hypothetical protein LWW93_04905 [Hyphomicrobiales bacterium]|nr:hypothetical protein [Hyphomicrobiales bacterium]